MYEDSRIVEMFERYSDMIYRVANSYCNNVSMAEDIVQDVFLRFMKSRQQFENQEHEKAWFIRVAINCCKSQLTSSWMKRMRPLEEAKTITFEREEESELYDIILEMPVKYRIVLYLYYYEEYSVNDIAKLLHALPNTVSARLSRARKMLKGIISIELEGCINE